MDKWPLLLAGEVTPRAEVVAEKHAHIERDAVVLNTCCATKERCHCYACNTCSRVVAAGESHYSPVLAVTIDRGAKQT